MSDSSGRPWTDNPYAPNITYGLYLGEKENFAGNLIGAIFYGIVIVLFFQCMGALLDPVNRRSSGIKWGLVAHTMAMFASVTVYTAMSLHLHSISYIDNREFPGIDGGRPGPLGYQLLIISKPISVVPNAMFPLNQWLADGLLLYRCYAIYLMNFWAIAFPFLLYLGSVVTGILVTYHQAAEPLDNVIDFGIPFFAISLSLNVLLTSMIVIRLVRHMKDIQGAIGPLFKPNRLYGIVITILVESCALYVVSFVLYIGPWGAGDGAQLIFFPILTQVQVIAPLLVVLRVANDKAITSLTVDSQDIGVIHLSQEKSTGDGSERGLGGNRSGESLGMKFATSTIDSRRSDV